MTSLDESPISSAPPPAGLRRSARRRWLFRGMAVLVGVLPFLLLEFGLWLCGFGHDLRLIVAVGDSPGWYRFNHRFDEAFYGATDLSGPDERPFRMPKPEGTFRIVVVGGSTVIGFPYAPELAFPRQLEVLLEDAGQEGVTFEVLNAGITALNSCSEAVVVEEAMACDPDLLIVYTGHNEFYGPNGAAAERSLTPDWYRFLSRWKRLRVVQLLRRVAASAHPQAEGVSLIEHFATDLNLSETSPIFRTAERRLEDNLESMVSSGRRNGVPIVLAGPASNERHQAPIEAALPSRRQSGEPSWQETVREAENHLRFEHPELALPLLESVAGDVQSAIVQFRLAQALDRMGRLEAAAPHYRRARELDGARFRAPSAFVDVFQRVAAHHAEDRVFFIDLQQTLEEQDASGVLGRREFLEHVHFTWEGNAAMAKALARFTAAHRLVPVTERVDFSSELAERSLMVQPEELLAGQVVGAMVYQTPPFSEASDAKLSAQRLAAEVLSGTQQLATNRRALFDQLTSRELFTDPLSSLIRHARAAGQSDLQGIWLDARVHRRPWSCPERWELLDWLSKQGRIADAESVERNFSEWPCLRPIN